MKLYHGSGEIITAPEYGKGNYSNDYGRGFYCTENFEIAAEWACKKGQDGFVNSYDLDLSDLNVCNLNSEKYHILNWLALLTRYRGYWQQKSIASDAKEFLQEHYLIDLTGVDIVVGYRADDSYFSFVQDFITGTISLQTLSKAMRLGKLGEQVVLKSEKAFEKLTYVSFQEVPMEEYYVKKNNRDLAARRAYRDAKEKHRIDDIYMLDIMRGRVSDDELRI